MQAIMLGNIAAAVSAHVAEALGDAVEEDILKGIVKEILPDCGIVIGCAREEIKDNDALKGILYNQCVVKAVKKKKERTASPYLHLPMKKVWYDMIKSGEKKEEYRELKSHWSSRIGTWLRAHNENPTTTKPVIWEATGKMMPILFFNGYHKNAPSFIGYCDRIEYREEAKHPEWGECEYKNALHFVFRIDHIEENR